MRSINTSLSPQEVKRDQNDAGAVILQKQSLGPKDTKAVPLAGTNQDRIAQLVDARQLAAQQIHTKQIGAEETGRGSPRERLLLLYDDMAFRQSRANAHAMLKADPPPQTFQEKRQWEAEKAQERRSEPTGMHGSAQKRWIAETQTLQADLQGIMRDIQSAVEQRVRDQVVSEVLQELIGKAITQAEQAAEKEGEQDSTSSAPAPPAPPPPHDSEAGGAAAAAQGASSDDEESAGAAAPRTPKKALLHLNWLLTSDAYTPPTRLLHASAEDSAAAAAPPAQAAPTLSLHRAESLGERGEERDGEGQRRGGGQTRDESLESRGSPPAPALQRKEGMAAGEKRATLATLAPPAALPALGGLEEELEAVVRRGEDDDEDEAAEEEGEDACSTTEDEDEYEHNKNLDNIVKKYLERGQRGVRREGAELKEARGIAPERARGPEQRGRVGAELEEEEEMGRGPSIQALKKEGGREEEEKNFSAQEKRFSCGGGAVEGHEEEDGGGGGVCSARVALAEAAEQLRHAPRSVVLCGCRGEGEAGGGGLEVGAEQPQQRLQQRPQQRLQQRPQEKTFSEACGKSRASVTQRLTEGGVRGGGRGARDVRLEEREERALWRERERERAKEREKEGEDACSTTEDEDEYEDNRKLENIIKKYLGRGKRGVREGAELEEARGGKGCHSTTGERA